MQLLYFLESIRIPVLDAFMLLITRLGEETAFLVMALIIFWCVDKRQGYYLMSVGFLGTMANQFLKIVCRVPRPWVLDENFTILEQAREAATGYSFPSGHSQNAVSTFGAIAVCTGNKIVKYLCIAVCVLVPLSRMYIGVHTPWDVLVGAALAAALLILLKKPVLKGSDATMRVLLTAMVLLSALQLAFVEFWTFPADVDAENLESALKNAYTMLGCTCGISAVWYAERKYVAFSAKAVWWAQILKAVIGLAVVLAVKEGLRAPLELVFSGHMAARAVRYFLMVVAAGFLWPMSFSFFAKLGVKK